MQIKYLKSENLKTRGAPGYDKISTKTIKQITHIIAIKTTDIFNSHVSTTLNDVISEESRIETVVQQGSVLGPKLYLLYIHNIQNAGFMGKHAIFADDPVLMYHGRTENTN